MGRSARSSRLLVLLVAMVFALAACGGGGGSGSSGSSGSGASSAPTASPSGDANAQVQAAQQVVEKGMQPTTELPLKTPLTAKPAAGKTVVWLQCEFPPCVAEGKGMTEAASALGWKLQIIPFKSSDPNTLLDGMNTALRYKPDAVVLSGMSQKLWQSALPAYQSAKVPLVALTITDAQVADPIIARVGGGPFYRGNGSLIGNWMVADSKAAGKALVVDLPYFPVVKEAGDGIKEAITKGCTNCSVTPLDLTVPDLTNARAVPNTIAALRKDPSIGYVLASTCDLLNGLPAQLAATGLKGKVKVACVQGSAASGALVKTGDIQAQTGVGVISQGWMVIDVVARHLAGMPIDPVVDQGTPYQLVTKDNIGEPTDSLDLPTDYQAQYKKLWLVG